MTDATRGSAYNGGPSSDNSSTGTTGLIRTLGWEFDQFVRNSQATIWNTMA